MSKVVLITGASSGLGRSIAEKLSNHDFIVYGTSRNPKEIDAKYKLLKFDITEYQDAEKITDYLISKHGKIDILINNAGISITGPVESSEMDDIKNLYDTNFFGHINLIQNVVPHMRKNMSGLIINITSIAGYLGLPFQSIYCASKASLNLLGESLNMELKNFNVKVVNLAPGDYKTEIIDNRRDSILDNNSPYNPEYSSFTKAITRGMSKKGNDPREIADMVFKIINSKNPKIHYLSGKFIQKLVTLKEFIPDMIFEKIVMKMYKLK